MKIAGSSTLTRGKHAAPHSTREQIGLIPAHAGKTRGCPETPGFWWAHPRSRGENALPSPSALVDKGSSPLTRGKHPHRRATEGPRGLIPAHAGKTRRATKRAPRLRAHPRSRGENSCRPDSSHTRGGSSPLTRGKRGRGVCAVRAAGLIPAHAGKTSVTRPETPACRAHPRSRGENTAIAVNFLGSIGSSPLTRGKPQERGAPPEPLGLIPAHAGKT